MRRSGLDRIRWIDAVEDFVRLYGHETPRWSIFCTYEINIEAISRIVMPVLSRRRCFRTIVLSDAGTLEKALTQFSGEHEVIPGAINLHPIRLKRGMGVFHPKLALLRAGRHVRACFGSANLTDGGFGTNLELWSYTEEPEIIAGLAYFLNQLQSSHHLVMDDSAKRSLRRALSGITAQKTKAVWSSLDKSFKQQLQDSSDHTAKSVCVVSPLYASEGGLNAARSIFLTRNLIFYTDEPAKAPNCTVRQYSPQHVADQINDPEVWPQRLHAKAYLIRKKKDVASALWVGSANFTAQALTKKVGDKPGSNIELMIRATLTENDASSLRNDLNNESLFRICDAPPKTKPPRTPPAPRAMSTVISCELIRLAIGYRLKVHTTLTKGEVVLVINRQNVSIPIKNGCGIVEANKLALLLPDIDDYDTSQTMVAHQLIQNKRIPIIINVPHVPPIDESGSLPQLALDAMLDDLLGTLRLPRKSNVETDRHDMNSNGDKPDTEVDKYEKRLDEVKHQGEIDQLAVKAALLKKLVTKVMGSGVGRDNMLRDILEVLLKVSPSHLKSTIKAHFDM